MSVLLGTVYDGLGAGLSVHADDDCVTRVTFSRDGSYDAANLDFEEAEKFLGLVRAADGDRCTQGSRMSRPVISDLDCSDHWLPLPSWLMSPYAKAGACVLAALAIGCAGAAVVWVMRRAF